MLSLVIDPETGVTEADARRLAGQLGLAGAAADQAVAVMRALDKAFGEFDASLIELNPLAVTAEGALLALDVKMVLDDTAQFRHADLAALRAEEELDQAELEAQRYNLNYVHLDGQIGGTSNGAGRALSTVDLLRELGGTPGDFLAVRPAATGYPNNHRCNTRKSGG